MKIRTLAASLLAASCMGCMQTNVNVLYDSEPKYAALYNNEGGFLGACPIKLHYSVNDSDRARGHVIARGLTAKWPSGAERSHSSISLYLNGQNQVFVFSRPDVPGRQIDVAFELEKEKLGIERQRTAIMDRDTKTREDEDTRRTLQKLQNDVNFFIQNRIK